MGAERNQGGRVARGVLCMEMESACNFNQDCHGNKDGKAKGGER